MMTKRSPLVCLIVVGLLGIALAPAGYAKAKKKSGNTSTSVSGTCEAISPTHIIVLANGDNTKAKTYLVNDQTKITGNVSHGVKVTVTHDGTRATSIKGEGG